MEETKIKKRFEKDEDEDKDEDKDFLIESIDLSMPSTSRGLHHNKGKNPTTKEKISQNPLLDSLNDMQDDLYTVQLNVEQFTNLSSFKNAIKNNLKKQLPAGSHIDPRYLEETCLDIASKNGLTEFVRSLLDVGANPNKINYKQRRAPIHFATEGGHVDTLEVLLMHPKTNLNLQVRGQTALHIAIEKNNPDCVRLLIEKGAGASIPDEKGLTALHLAATNNQRDIVELILQKCKQRPNLDKYKGNGDQTTRQVIQEKMPELSLPPISEDTPEILLQDLKYYLSVNDEENFIENMNKLFAHKEFSCEMVEELLEIAARRDLHEAVRAIIREEFDKNTDRIQQIVWKAAHTALDEGYYETLRELLEIRLHYELINDLIRSACKKLEMGDRVSDRLECLELILNVEGVTVRFADSQGNTPLHYAARTGCYEAITWVLERGGYIGHMNKFNEPPIANIPEYMLSEYFNKCMKISDDKLQFDYSCLMPHQTDESSRINYECDRPTSEMKLFMYIAGNEDLKHLLRHPLFSSFLYIKWYRIRYFLCANFVFYFIFYLLLNVYILYKTYDIREENKTQIANSSSYMESNMMTVLKIVGSHQSLFWILITMLLFLIFRELFQLFFSAWRYFKEWRNWLQIVLITLIIIMLCNASIEIGAAVILLSACELVSLIGHHPRMSTGIEMFRKVSINFICILFPYLFLIFAFAMIFYIFFKENTYFSHPIYAFFQTIIMLPGEFNANAIDFLPPFWSHIAFLLFVFLITIVLLNLLNGLAVSDTAEILSTAELVGLISRIHLISYFEDMIAGNPFKFTFLRSFNPFSFLTKRIFLKHYIRNGIITFNNDDNTPYINRKFGILKMDPNIVKNVEQIISNNHQISSNREMMNKLKEIQKELTVIEDTLSKIL